MPVEISIAGVLAYLGVAVVFGFLTLAEGAQGRLRWGPYRLAGLALCLVWPVLVVGVILALFSADRRRRH